MSGAANSPDSTTGPPLALPLAGVRVGAWATIGAGAAVVHDIPDGVLAVGVPARSVVA
mgnify:CR=1 FL=1